MNNHPTKYKGDVTTATVALDLLRQHWFVMEPMFSEHAPFDLVAFKLLKNGRPKFIRVQVKTGKPTFKAKYEGTIDYFATVTKHTKSVCYIPASMEIETKGIFIRDENFIHAAEFWWYKDFLKPSNKPKRKRSIKEEEFKFHYDRYKRRIDSSFELGKESRAATKLKIRNEKYGDPSILQQRIWKYSMVQLTKVYPASDVGIKKFCRRMGIIRPPIGYWSMSPKKQERIYRKNKALIVSNIKRLRAI